MKAGSAIGLVVLLAAWVCYPVLRYRPQLVALDDMPSWGLKCNGLSTLTPNMRGIYFLSGNLAPWTADNRCSIANKGNRTVCRNGYKRSQHFLIDTSHCYFNARTGVITQRSAAMGISEHAAHGGGLGVAYYLQLLRVGYSYAKNDPEFVTRSISFFEGRVTQYVLGMSVKTLTGLDYRTTAEDVRKDGSVIMRYAWKDSNASVPAKKTRAFHDYTYEMKRVMDGEGKVNKAVLKEIKRIFGRNVIMPL